MSIAIRDATPDDAEAICRIYNPHILNTIVTFEEMPVTAGDMRTRIAVVTAKSPWLVAVRDGAVAGYAYAASFHERIGYRHTVVTTVYVDESVHGKGIGTALYRDLLDRLRARSIHAAIGIIALPNPGSIALHEKCGFRKAGHFDQVGSKFGRWIDVGYWQIVL
jgi:phosphinothricin acetyltransferase